MDNISPSATRVEEAKELKTFTWCQYATHHSTLSAGTIRFELLIDKVVRCEVGHDGSDVESSVGLVDCRDSGEQRPVRRGR